ncbi:DUF368 domain-containing protein [Agrococcus sp. SGAir0287]|uniref:DUF368 domain-containing protein n=1 Tax=Agrococcus sp. SGAir0287 TaxID=2070347 RepID=UPI0010CCE979|nr:DUF368 domain-containing protein [Agrococcus sp. SGAir0287]QCR18250.1 DUF368 domain-containing protein [Agrococcus sp. SGAir0287]
MPAIRTLVDLLRGALIGVVEVIPGVSGGTVALLIGVYERLLASASSLVRGVVHAVVDPVRGRGLARARGHLAQVSWRVVVPVGLGMVLALVTAARVVEPLLDEHPTTSRALFAGLIVASLVVPARMLGARWRARDVAVAVAAAVGGFLLTGLPPATVVDPSPFAILGSAALAVCALVLPGVSGSFVLLSTGMYQPALAALNGGDVPTIALFMAGGVLGLAVFVHVLRWLLASHRRVTLAVMTGLMAGSLRALWPWQSDDRDLLAPSGDVAIVVAWFVVGLVLVGAVLAIEHAVVRRRRSAAGAERPADA